MSKWVVDNPVLVAGFSARARSLTEPVKAGVRYGLTNGGLDVDKDGGLHASWAPGVRPITRGDAAEIIRKAGFVGKWLGTVEQPATAFALFGVRP